ncbi:ABC transporter ATP-binding protein [Peribacillus butanolivorans]|uniref:ABC transporter ATP-binding protein n=1 Tax=Peribacillus butanolivorans TaxID=421767 RepID=UPI00207C945B|nr:ABC transporter ATP-binding protein [Peribacillus butanolivorans]MCO0600707.1 ABC transporter ATP-binding protein [Peribacillus butanolivorans]
MAILKTEKLSKTYFQKQGNLFHKALDNFTMDVQKGEFVGVMGPSGSGKTTLLNLMATIDRPTSGKVILNEKNPNELKNRDLALFRRREIGFVFQDFNLLDTLTVRENILLPLALDHYKQQEMKDRVNQLAHLLSIEGILDKRTFEISGGQQQRTSCARAMIHEPSIILADEPTGNLDSKSAKQVMDTFTTLQKEKGASILMVTHDPTAASFCDRILFIKDGKFFSEVHNGGGRQSFYQRILDTLSVLGGGYHEPSTSR